MSSAFLGEKKQQGKYYVCKFCEYVFYHDGLFCVQVQLVLMSMTLVCQTDAIHPHNARCFQKGATNASAPWVV